MKAKLHNRFDFEIYDPDTGETQYAKAEGIILDQLRSALCEGPGFFVGYIAVGEGTGELSPTRTSLFSPIAHARAMDEEVVFDTDYTAHRTRYRVFSSGYSNSTWTEVGLAYGNEINSLVTHALITDEYGNPTPIEKTPTNVISIFATVYVEVIPPAHEQYHIPPATDNRLVTGLLGTTGLVYIRAYLTTLLRADGSPAWTGTSAGHLTGFQRWEVDSVNRRVYKTTRFDASGGNGVVRGILLGSDDDPRFWASGGDSQLVGISTPNSLVPNNSFSEVIIGEGDGAETQFDFPWPFVKPGSETIYVDGAPQTRGVDYTVRYGMRGGDTLLVDMPDKSTIVCGDTLEEIIALPQPVGEEVDITAIELKNGSLSGLEIKSYDIKLSLDGETWVDAGSDSLWDLHDAVVFLDSFPPGKYKYMKVNFTSRDNGSNGLLSYIRIYATPPDTKHIVFTNPPQAGADITADFSVDYIAKTSDFAVDVHVEFRFGEGE